LHVLAVGAARQMTGPTAKRPTRTSASGVAAHHCGGTGEPREPRLGLRRPRRRLRNKRQTKSPMIPSIQSSRTIRGLHNRGVATSTRATTTGDTDETRASSSSRIGRCLRRPRGRLRQQGRPRPRHPDFDKPSSQAGLGEAYRNRGIFSQGRLRTGNSRRDPRPSEFEPDYARLLQPRVAHSEGDYDRHWLTSTGISLKPDLAEARWPRLRLRQQATPAPFDYDKVSELKRTMPCLQQTWGRNGIQATTAAHCGLRQRPSSSTRRWYAITAGQADTAK